MEAKHTKGDWQAVAPNPHADESAGERKTFHWSVHTSYVPERGGRGGVSGHKLCEISSLNTGAEEADARLIAAAPELLEACLKLVEWDEREKDHAISFRARIDLCDEAFSAMRAAITKATQ